jgi:hypothetical protein
VFRTIYTGRKFFRKISCLFRYSYSWQYTCREVLKFWHYCSNTFVKYINHCLFFSLKVFCASFFFKCMVLNESVHKFNESVVSKIAILRLNLYLFEWFVIIECDRTDKYTNLFTKKLSTRNSLNYINNDRYCNRKKLSHSSEALS